MGDGNSLFQVIKYRLSYDIQDGLFVAAVSIKVNGKTIFDATEGDDAFNVLSGAMYKTLHRFFPDLREIPLDTYGESIRDAKSVEDMIDFVVEYFRQMISEELSVMAN